jgi:hypothetical protein
MAPPAAFEAQEPRVRMADYAGVGTYRGRRYGTHTDTTYAGDTVTEETECTLTMTFNADGSMSYDAGEYLYRKTYRKKTQQGFEVAVTEIRSPGGQSKIRSRLSMQVTEFGLVRKATWQPAVEVPGTVSQQVTWTDAHGRVRNTSYPTSQNRLVSCDMYVLWTGLKRNGPGLPLKGQITQRDSVAKRPWIHVDVQWDLQPVQR